MVEGVQLQGRRLPRTGLEVGRLDSLDVSVPFGLPVITVVDEHLVPLLDFLGGHYVKHQAGVPMPLVGQFVRVQLKPIRIVHPVRSITPHHPGVGPVPGGPMIDEVESRTEGV